MPGYYTRIADALSNLLIGEKVWAIDVFRALGNGNNYVGKTFVLATPFAMYRKMVFHRHPSVYEVIQSQTPVKLYLDVEFEVTAEEENLAKTECINIIEFFKYIIIKHLQLAFPTQEVKMEGMQIFQACTEKKFSIHIVHNDVVFDNAQVSCMAYVGELEAYLKYVLATEVGELPPNVDAIMAIHRLQCHCGKMIDLSVYKKNQQYRTLGSTKLNKNRPFQLYASDYFDWTDTNIWTFDGAAPSVSLFVNSLVTTVSTHVEPLRVRPSDHLKFVAPKIAMREFYRNIQFSDDMNPNGRFLLESSVDDKDRVEIVNKLLELTPHGTNSIANSTIVDDTEMIATEYGGVCRIRDLQHQQCVFCRQCETRIVNQKPIGIGKSSAKVFVKANGEKFITCFHCENIEFILEVGDQYGFVATDSEMIETPHSKLNFGGRMDVDFDSCGRLVFLDAPMGSGKTFVADQYLRRHINQSVLCITFRISLAKYLAQQFSLASYLDEDIWDSNAKESRRRFVICLDSLWRLKETEYDIVLLDEGTFIQYHFVAGTIRHQIDRVIDVFRAVLENSPKVIVMQYRIPETTITFYANIMGLDINSDAVTKRKFDRPTTLKPMHSYAQLNQLLSALIGDYVSHYDEVDGRSKAPIVVFTSRADFAMMLMWILRGVAKSRFGDDAAEKIKGIWAQVQEDTWVKQFLQNPNAHALQCDILIATSVLQAGHSLDAHFVTSYDILFLGVLTFREELQFISRLRYLGRNDMRAYKHAWIQPGKANSKVSSFHRLKNAVQDLSTQGSVPIFLSSILAGVRSEIADTMNRHTYLWRREYSTSGENIIRIDYFVDEYFNENWIKEKTKEWFTKNGKGIRRLLASFENYDTSLSEVLEECEFSSIADVMELHIGSSSSSLKDRIRCSDRVFGYNVVVNLLPPKNLGTISKISKYLVPFYELIVFLDRCLFDIQPINVEDPGYWWRTRRAQAGNKQIGLASLDYVDMILQLLHQFGGWKEGYGLHEDQWQRVATTEDIFQILRLHESTCMLILGDNMKAKYANMKREEQAEQPTKVNNTPNRLLSLIFRRVGLTLDCQSKNTPVRISDIAEKLCICRVLIPDNHFSLFRTILPPEIWDSMQQLWIESGIAENMQSNMTKKRKRT